MEKVKEKEKTEDFATGNKSQQYTATGRRKVSRARIRLIPGKGKIVVNKRLFENYFPREVHRIVIRQPLKAVKAIGKFDIYVNVNGGGVTGQAEAIRHGIARALVRSDESLRSILKKAKFLTRDPRIKERKKYGRKRARKKFQYTKR